MNQNLFTAQFIRIAWALFQPTTTIIYLVDSLLIQIIPIYVWFFVRPHSPNIISSWTKLFESWLIRSHYFDFFSSLLLMSSDNNSENKRNINNHDLSTTDFHYNIFFYFIIFVGVLMQMGRERERGKQRNSTHTHSTQFIINYENYSEHDSFLHMISFTFPRFSLWNRKRIVFPHPNRWKFSVSGFENFDYSSESFFYFVKTYLKFKKKSQCFWRFFRKFVQFWLLLQKKDDLNHFCRIHVTVFNALEVLSCRSLLLLVK